ncbi:MAG: hypothetical protein LBU90_02265 [Bacteroidales bacterium]|jgi:hypothetical protein|nr:hypothetical protein [Bacteroidales bacterium]
MKDYSMYRYYKGEEENPFENKGQGINPNQNKYMFWYYEQGFDAAYQGKPENKNIMFGKWLDEFLYEKASDFYMFGTPGRQTKEEKSKYLKKMYEFYENPD